LKARKSESNNVRKELVREQLIDKAAELFSTRGYSRTTIQDIARAMRLSRSSLYHYFRSKEEVLKALIEDQTIGPSQAMEKLVGDNKQPAAERLRQAVINNILHKLTGSARFRVLDQIEFEMPEKIAVLHKRTKRHVLELWSNLISDAISAGEFRDVDARMAAFAVIGMSVWTAWWYSPEGQKSPQEIAETIADIALRGLLRTDRDRPAADTLGTAINALKEDLKALERLAR
jgi:AcrR family transcriptional regulator